MLILDEHQILTPDQHQTHRHLQFVVPPGCRELWFEIRYAPKFLTGPQAERAAWAALDTQTASFAKRVGDYAAEAWAQDQIAGGTHNAQLANLLTVSIDDADRRYRGAGHRHAAQQRLVLSADHASPGLVPGALPPGQWTLTISAHTVVSDQVSLSIQIGAEMASRAPSGVRSSA